MLKKKTEQKDLVFYFYQNCYTSLELKTKKVDLFVFLLYLSLHFFFNQETEKMGLNNCCFCIPLR